MDFAGTRVDHRSTEVLGINFVTRTMWYWYCPMWNHLWCSFAQSPQALDDPKSSSLCAHRLAEEKCCVEQVHNKKKKYSDT